MTHEEVLEIIRNAGAPYLAQCCVTSNFCLVDYNSNNDLEVYAYLELGLYDYEKVDSYSELLWLKELKCRHYFYFDVWRYGAENSVCFDVTKYQATEVKDMLDLGFIHNNYKLLGLAEVEAD